MAITIPLSCLKRWNPFEHELWRGMGGRPLTREEVEAAIAGGRLRKTPLGPGRYDTGRRSHIHRVAYLVVNPDPKELDIEVGVPQLDQRSVPHWPIIDGNHRLAAAFYRGDETISVDIGGSVKYAEELFGLKLCIRHNSMQLREDGVESVRDTGS